MIKYVFALMLVCLYVACMQPSAKQNTAITASTTVADTSHKQPLANDMMITPGGGIGKITIGEDADSTMSVLGKPDGGDAAMGAQVLTWYANHDSTGHQTNVYAHRNMGADDEQISRIKAIRVTSPEFNTAEHVHTGLPFIEIKKHFNLYHKTSRNADGFTTYEDDRAGIAFELNSQNICTAIIVFGRGGSSVNYLNMGQ